MARTAPVPNIPAIPGMNPGVFVMGGGGGGGGSGAGSGNGSKSGQGSDGKNGGSGAGGGGKSACGSPGKDGGGCPQHHGGNSSGAASHGDPIDVITGRVFTAPVVDLDLPGPLPLQLARSYSTTSRERDIGLGHGWTHSFAWEVELRRGGGAKVWTDDGLDVSFGVVERDTGVIGPHGWVLHRHEEGFALDVPDGTRRIFEPDLVDPARRRFRLAAVEDRAGNRMQLHYGGALLSRIVDSVDRTIRVLTTRDGRIAALEVVCASGRVVRAATYELDPAGNLAKVTDADGHATAYTYDDAHRLTSYRLPTGLVFFFRYDREGRGIETWGEHESGVEPCLADDLPELLADRNTRAKGIHHVKIEYGPDGYSEVADAACVFRYFGNAHGKADKAVANGRVFTRTYDARGHLTSYTDAMGATTRWERDLVGNETRVIDALGQETRIERLPNGDITRVVDPGGGETVVEYTNDALLIKAPTGALFELRYDARGLPLQTMAPNGRGRRYRYDDHANAVEASDERGVVLWQARYDELGRCTSIRDESGAVTSYKYSNKGLLVSLEEPGGQIWRFVHDGLGNVIEEIDPGGRRTVLVRGGTGSLVEARLPDRSTVRLRYDRKERLVRIVNARGETYSFKLGPTGLKQRERTFDGREISYEHDLAGRVVRVSFASGHEVFLERDLLGRIVKRTRADGTEETFEHDFRDDVLAAETACGRVEFVRNAAGAIVKERQIVGGEVFEVQVEHDAIGLPVRLRTSLGHTAEWCRNYAGHSFTLRLDGAEEMEVRLDVAGRETERALSRGGRVLLRYDLAGRLAERQVTSTALERRVRPGEPAWTGAREPATTIHQRMEYSASSELAALWDARFGWTRYQHDALGQLVAVVPEGARGELFAYDPAGNVHDASGTGASREYGVGDLLVRAGATALVWDELGRLTERRARTDAGERVTSYRWAEAGTLSEVVLPDGSVVEYAYDAFARRLKKEVYRRGADGSRQLLRRTRFYWHGSTLLHEVTDADEVKFERRYSFDEDGEPLAHKEIVRRGGEIHGGAWVYYVNDLAGFPERLLGGDGQIIAEIARTAWGEAAMREGARAATPLRFLGHYADAETGLHYNRYRYYDPALGRYISPDPVEPLGGLNTFAYARNDPFGYGDPWGLVYTRIVDNSTRPATVLYEGYNIDEARNKKPEAGGQIPHNYHKNSCAETQALQRMKNDITAEVESEQNGAKKRGNKREPFVPMTKEQKEAEVNSRLKAKFDNPNVSIETFQNKGGNRVNPCDLCQQMFANLGISHAVVGEEGKRGKFGKYRRR
ncbi:RHS repeat-associated core domain-containing protein [Sorangium sp. So ce1078]|uniref:RHS repeat-associated core domain-containing protein n=1 Tax=Sorangium sp. So ce1078 TaxID=3133329 RepID=UPI003F62E495